MALGVEYNPDNVGLGQKLKMVSWPLLLILCIIAGVGFCMLYSAGNGNWEPWASRQLTRFIFGAAILLLIAVTDIRIWLRYSYFIYFLSLALLIAVELKGVIGMGAQRWIDLKFVQLQPSEIMKMRLRVGKLFKKIMMRWSLRKRPLFKKLRLILSKDKITRKISQHN